MDLEHAAEVLGSLRETFTPLTFLHGSLLVGEVSIRTLVKVGHWQREEPEAIWLLQQGIWHTSVGNLGVHGNLTDIEVCEFVNPFEATQNLLQSIHVNVDTLVSFLHDVRKQPHAEEILKRCIRDSSARMVWVERNKLGQGFPTERRVDELLKMAGLSKERGASAGG